MIFDEILETIENDDMKEFAQELIKTIPEYFWSAPASSTGKYHPAYALGDGGLARHTCAVVRFLNHIFNIELFSSRERDMMRIAGMMHDTRKSGSQENYLENSHTRFEHPILAAEVIKGFYGKHFISDQEICTIADMIERHMGKWRMNDRSDVILPIPVTKMEKLLHECDYLASRQDIEVIFNN